MITSTQPSTVDAVGQHYDELDRFYREVWGDHVHHGLWITGEETPETAAVQLLERVAQAARLQPGERVCDVGCGYGATARWIADRFDAAVTGLTVSAEQYHRARDQSGPDGPTFLLQDWLENDLPSASFDAVIFIESLSHMPDQRRAIREAARVLRPGGRLVIAAWMTDEWPRRWMARHIIEPICREGQLPGMPSATDVQRTLVEAGLQLDRFEELSAQVQKTWDVVIRRVVWGVIRTPSYRRYLVDKAQQNRRFALTLIRLWIGYRIGAIRYGLFAAHKPDEPADPSEPG
jgi:tocopherol O-methyltransferase